ncbi:MAG TPA: Clp protease N-terminal domain-containing protein, partial [Polyangium sp.]|nr:Clp protease N-terminal domain-containing protein [Polyangium sp.]
MRTSPEVDIAINLATREAVARRHEYVTVEHLLYALTFDEEIARIINKAGGQTQKLKKRLEQFLDNEIEPLPEHVDAAPQFSLGFRNVVGRAAVHVQT